MKKNEIITKYQRLKDYTLWYYFRYYPSIWKLKFKLRQKTQNNEDLISKLFEDIGNLFIDKPVIESKIQNYLFRNKNKNYIITQLIAKQFKREEVLEIFYNLTTRDKSLLSHDYVYKKVVQLKNKNKSIQYIKNKLIEQPEDKDLVESTINEIFKEKWENRQIKKEIEKLSHKNLEQQKIIQKLLQKWFRYDDIKNSLNNY